MVLLYLCSTWFVLPGGREEVVDLLERGGGNGLDRLGHPLVRRRQHALHERALARLVVVRGGSQGQVLGTQIKGRG